MIRQFVVNNISSSKRVLQMQPSQIVKDKLELFQNGMEIQWIKGIW